MALILIHASACPQQFSQGNFPVSLRVAETALELNMNHTILRLPAVLASTGYSRSTIYLRINQGLWPKPISLGARAVGWPEKEIGTMNAARIAGKTDAQLKTLVATLERNRQQAQ